ncbi:uncharacterized protein LOC105440286 [Strongylocentrotus purpuratus]|uniref:C-type lectin domain-containing protein n=1 Tax=Strongylocentrotus purpuratus TaxID=7668 RepID=A0A7M7N372_STRPU|nr:uncharacterized protein LOC105440286 [Strongylocentrotus purpuratus]
MTEIKTNAKICLLVTATTLSGSVAITPLTGVAVVGGDDVVVEVNASLTASDELTHVNVSLECTNAKLNSTTDVLPNFSSIPVPTISQVGYDNISTTFGPMTLELNDVLEFSWITQWFIPDSVNPAATITCEVNSSYQNPSLLVQSDILYSNSLLLLAPKINLTNADDESYDGVNRNSVDIGEEIRINIVAMVPQSNVELEVDIGPTNESINATAVNDLAITTASSRIVCKSKFAGQNCRTKTQAVYPQVYRLGFFDDEVSIHGDHSEVNDLVLQAKIRFGDDDVSDGDTAQLGVSMATARSHIWTSTISFNISDDGDPRSTVMDVHPMMTTHSLYNGYDAMMQVHLEHNSLSRASAEELELHLIMSPRTSYQGVSKLSVLTQPPTVDDSFVIFKIGAVDLFSSVELSINITVNHTNMKAGVSKMVILAQAVYKNDTNSTTIGQATMVDVQFQYADKYVPCKTPWQPFLSSCYYANASGLVNANVAAQVCEEEGGALASIDSIFEERFLVDISPKDLSPFRFWIHENSTYTNWLPGQPDAAGACRSLVVEGSYWSDGIENGDMETTSCIDLRYFICETSIDPPPEERKNQFHGVPQAGQALTDGWTCPCNYPSSESSCACCKSGTATCDAPGSHVCAQDSSQCPLEEFYDRSILSDDTGLRIACNNVEISSSEPSCVFSRPALSSTWKAFPLYIGDVVAYHNVSDTLYAIGRDSKTYLEGKFVSSSSTTDWSAISTERWMAARDRGDLTLHNLVKSSDYTNGDLLAWTCCG